MASTGNGTGVTGPQNEELTKLHEIANESSRNMRAAYLFFLLLLLYLVILVGSISDQDLLTRANVALPLLNVRIPVVGFYVLAPWLLVAFHANLLSQFYLLSRKLYAIEDRVGRDAPSGKKRFHLELLIFPLILNFAVLDFAKSWKFRLAFGGTTWATIVALPIIALCGLLASIARYQSDWLSLCCTLAVLVDLALIWTIWPKCIWGNKKWRERLRERPVPVAATGVFSLLIVYFAVFDAVPPRGFVEKYSYIKPLEFSSDLLRRGEREDKAAAVTDDKRHCSDGDRKADEFARWGLLDRVYRRYIVVERSVSPVTGLSARPNGHNTPLIVQRSGGNLRHATIIQADMPDADLNSTDLRFACVERSNLEGARLNHAKLDGASFEKSILKRARLVSVSAERTSFRKAIMIGADLGCAVEWESGRCAPDERTNLIGADFEKTDLTAANLREANLSGTDLEQADLTAAILVGAELLGAELHATTLKLADLRNTKIRESGISAVDVRFGDLRHLDSDLGKQSWLVAIGQLRITETNKFQLPLAEVVKRAEALLEDSIGHADHATTYNGDEESAIDSYFDELIPLLAEQACRGPSYAEGIVKRYGDRADGVEHCLLARRFIERCPYRVGQPYGQRPKDLLSNEWKNEVLVQSRENSLGDPTAGCEVSRSFFR